MSLLPGSPSIRELVVEAIIDRLKGIKPPNFEFDIKGRVYDVNEATELMGDLKPCVLLWQEAEVRDEKDDANTGGRYHRILQIQVKFAYTYPDTHGPGPTRRQAYAQRFLADVQKAIGTGFSVTVPLATNLGTPSGSAGPMDVHIYESDNALNLFDATDQVDGTVLYDVHYWRCAKDPKLH